MFEPDGLGTSGVFWLLGLACLVAVAVFGHLLGERHWKHALGRVGSVGVTALCLVLAVTGTLNHQYGWYTTWSDLFASFTGDHPAAVSTTFGAKPESVGQYDRAGARRIDEAADSRYAAQRTRFAAAHGLLKDAPHGQWIKINVPGLTVRGRDIGRVMIWLPPGYVSHPKRSYPVIEAFHGIPGGTLDYERVFFLDREIMRAQAAHKMRDAVIIVPQEMPAGIDTECVDGGGLNEETWLTSIVPNFIIQNLRAQADPHSWAALGTSAGGWCASMAGILHPNRYAGIVSLGGYFRPDFASGWNPFKGKPVPTRYDLTKQVEQHPSRQALWLLISGGDKLSGPASAEFAKVIRSPYALTTVDYPGAGHRVDVWERAMPDVMSWLGKTLPAFSYTAGETAASASAPPTAPHSGGAGSSLPGGVATPARRGETHPEIRTRG